MNFFKYLFSEKSLENIEKFSGSDLLKNKFSYFFIIKLYLMTNILNDQYNIPQNVQFTAPNYPKST